MMTIHEIDDSYLILLPKDDVTDTVNKLTKAKIKYRMGNKDQKIKDIKIAEIFIDRAQLKAVITGVLGIK